MWFTVNLSTEKVLRVVALMWVAWSYHNKVIFEHVIMVVDGYIRLVQEYGNYAKKKSVLTDNQMSNSRTNSWSCSPSGYVKVNTNAYFHQNVACDLGVVIWNKTGGCWLLQQKGLKLKGLKIAEAMAVRYGVQIARRFGYGDVNLKNNSFNVVHNVKNSCLG